MRTASKLKSARAKAVRHITKTVKPVIKHRRKHHGDAVWGRHWPTVNVRLSGKLVTSKPTIFQQALDNLCAKFCGAGKPELTVRVSKVR